MLTRAFGEMVFVAGFSWRKRRILRRFLPKTRITAFKRAEELPAVCNVLVWGDSPLPPGISHHKTIVRVEDGFLRSVGLGVELTTPLSWVFDARGLHFDCSKPSELEILLQDGQLSPRVVARAAKLRRRIVDAGLTKYGVGGQKWLRPARKEVILVVGQVESDASLRLGSPVIKTNMQMLEAVRAAHPKAYLVYKPHPDVVAGLRTQGSSEDTALTWCDEVVTETDLLSLFSQVDAVHVLTSLAGFEALLRGVSVTCHGLPFYAGWGLTRDLVPISRRTRVRTLDELVAAALLLYPSYISRATASPCDAERVLEDLVDWRARTPELPSVFRKLWRGALRVSLGVK